MMKIKMMNAGVMLLAMTLASCQNENENISDSNTATCDRACLEGFVNQYLDALVSHDASKAPFSDDVRFTENARELPLEGNTEGLWANTVALGDYKYYIADPQEGQVAFVGFVDEKSEADQTQIIPALLSMRLKIEESEISEVESIVIHNVNESNRWALTTPPAEYSTALAADEKVSRDELIKISNLYFDGIEQSNGSIVPWHEECYRLENGMWTAGPVLPAEIAAHMPDPSQLAPGPGGAAVSGRQVCSEGFDSGMFEVIQDIRPRRVAVVDEERGVTWGLYMFNHEGVTEITLPDGSVIPAPYFGGQPNSMPMSEIFKVKDGKIRDIMALGVINEYMSGSGWE